MRAKRAGILQHGPRLLRRRRAPAREPLAHPLEPRPRPPVRGSPQRIVYSATAISPRSRVSHTDSPSGGNTTSM